MELPDDIILLIRDFSRPVTRPDWRTIHHMGEVRFLWLIGSIYNRKRIPVIEKYVYDYSLDICSVANYNYIFRGGFICNVVKIE